MNNFIVSGKGFLMELQDVVSNKKHETTTTWTDKLREARRFTSKQAKNIIDKKKLDAFVCNPYEEEPIRDKWVVTKRLDYSYLTSEKHNILEWVVDKLMMESKTDVKFLDNSGKKEYYDYDEAVRICRERNMKMIEELRIKMNAK